jgi:hypothetical protein
MFLLSLFLFRAGGMHHKIIVTAAEIHGGVVLLGPEPHHEQRDRCTEKCHDQCTVGFREVDKRSGLYEETKELHCYQPQPASGKRQHHEEHKAILEGGASAYGQCRLC